MAHAKNEATAQYLMDILNQRLSSPGFQMPVMKNYTSDSPPRPYLSINSDGSLDAMLVFELQAPPASGAKDALGLASKSYSPQIIRLGYESGSGGTAASIAVTIGTPSNNDDIIVGGGFFTAKTSGAVSLQFNIGTAAVTAANLAAVINSPLGQSGIGVPVVATVVGAVVTITAPAHSGVYGNFINISTNNAVAFAIAGSASTFAGGVNDTVPACSDALKAILAIECARVGSEVRVYTVSGLTQTALDNDANLATAYRDLRFGMMGDV